MIDGLLGYVFTFAGATYEVRSTVWNTNGSRFLGLLCRRSDDFYYRIVDLYKLNHYDTIRPYIADLERTGQFHNLVYVIGFQSTLDNLSSTDVEGYYLQSNLPTRLVLGPREFAHWFGGLMAKSLSKGKSEQRVALDLLPPTLPPKPVINYDPYKAGTIVYFVSHGRVDERYGVGKIVELLQRRSSNGDYRYGVEFISHGYDEFSHKSLLPSVDYFDNAAKGGDCYIAKFDCGVLFTQGEKFILRGEYLHNKNSNVVLKYSKFQDKFKENDFLQVPADKANAV